jgi:TBC1 domain family member 15
MRAQLLTLDNLVQLMDPKLYLHLQSAESTNFFFFFRMLLVWYKREFELHDVLRLWECLWTDWLSSNFHLFIALAILEKHRNVLMDHLKYFDEVLKYSMLIPSCLLCITPPCTQSNRSKRTLQYDRPSIDAYTG